MEFAFNIYVNCTDKYEATVGWKARVDGKFYGDNVLIHNASDDEIAEACREIAIQAMNTIAELKERG